MDEPEWQCQLPIDSQPYHCQKRAEIANSLNGTGIYTLYDPDKKPGDPTFVHINDPPPSKSEEALDDRLRNKTLTKTNKPVLKETEGEGHHRRRYRTTVAIMKRKAAERMTAVSP